MNEVVKPNSAKANAEIYFDLKNKVETVASDVETLFELVEATMPKTVSVPTVISHPEKFVLSPTDVERAENWKGQWMTLSMIQYFLGAKSRKSAYQFFWRIEKSGDYEVRAVKLNPGKSREKMYKILDKAAS